MSGRHRVHDATGVVVENDGGNQLVSVKEGAPSDSAAGYETGSLLIDSTNKRHHINIGTAASSTWVRASARREIINVTTATKSLVLDDSGSLVVFDKADGIVLTLPEANSTNIGWFCDFLIKTTMSSTLSVDASRAADLYYGSVASGADNDGAVLKNKVHLPNQTSHDKLVLDGATKGWVQGGYFRVEIAAANMLVISGQLAGIGTSANPFV